MSSPPLCQLTPRFSSASPPLVARFVLFPCAANAVQAHKTKLALVNFNFTGTMLVTSSEKGTVIR